MVTISINPSCEQETKIKKGLTFQLNASNLSKPGYVSITLDSKTHKRYLKAIDNNKGFRFKEGEYQLSGGVDVVNIKDELVLKHPFQLLHLKR